MLYAWSMEETTPACDELSVLAQLVTVALRTLTADDVVVGLQSLFQSKVGVARVLSNSPLGAVGRFGGQMCLVPGRTFDVGTRLTVTALPAAAGLDWSLWAERVVVEDPHEGWKEIGRPPKPARPAHEPRKGGNRKGGDEHSRSSKGSRARW